MDAASYYAHLAPCRGRSPTRAANNFVKACVLSSNAPAGEGPDILDLGCGEGGDALKLARLRPRSYTGVDLCAAALTRAKIRMSVLACPRRILRMDFRRSLCRLPAAGYDLIVCNFSMHFAFSSEAGGRRFARGCRRLLRPCGRLIGAIPSHPGREAHSLVSVVLPGRGSRRLSEPVVTREALVAAFEPLFDFEFLSSSGDAFQTFASTMPETYAQMGVGRAVPTDFLVFALAPLRDGAPSAA